MLGDLKDVLDVLCGADPASLADGAAVVELHRCMARLEAVVTRAGAAFEAGGEWAGDGARSAPAWLAQQTRVPKAAAARRLALGRALRNLPAAKSAWLAGDIGVAQVGALASARTAATGAAMDRDEAMLVDQARTLRHDEFTRVLAYWTHHADPDGTEDAADKAVEDRSFHLSQSFGGAWLGTLVLDPISGAVVDNVLRRIEAELFAADWAEARARVGEGVRPGDVGRSPAQRRADALVEMARRAGAAPEGGRRPEPLFTVLVGYETFKGRICELADGTVVAPGRLAPWLDEAWIERVVFDPPSRVIDVGVTRRLFDGATRRAIEVRDHECFHRFCDVRSGRCQADHVEPWAAGGRTTQANGRMACGFHNRERHRRPDPPPRE